MEMQIEAYFRELCKQHDMFAVTVGFHTGDPGRDRFTCSVHWVGFARDGNPCETGIGVTVNGAVEKALAAMAICRTPVAADEPQITVEAA